MDPQVSSPPPSQQPQPLELPPSITRHGKLLRLHRQGFPLPTDRCFKCNAPATVKKRKTLAWHTPILYLVLLSIVVIGLLGIFAYIIVALLAQKRASVEFGLCKRCHERRILWLCIWTFALISAIPLFTLGVSTEEARWFYLGPAAFLGGAIGLAVCSRLAKTKYIDDLQIHLGGCGQKFRDTFPEG